MRQRMPTLPANEEELAPRAHATSRFPRPTDRQPMRPDRFDHNRDDGFMLKAVATSPLKSEGNAIMECSFKYWWIAHCLVVVAAFVTVDDAAAKVEPVTRTRAPSRPKCRACRLS